MLSHCQWALVHGRYPGLNPSSFWAMFHRVHSLIPETVVQVSWQSREKNGRWDWSARTGWKALRRHSPEHTVTVYIWIMNSQSHDSCTVWTKRHPQGLSRASLGVPLGASSTVDGGGGKSICNRIFSRGTNVPSRPLTMLGRVVPIGPLSQSH